jgi:hypothetical protein
MHIVAGGKSAVLTAITIALGGKAATTGRGSGLKSFIREGQGYASFTPSLSPLLPRQLIVKHYHPQRLGDYDRTQEPRRGSLPTRPVWQGYRDYAQV